MYPNNKACKILNPNIEIRNPRGFTPTRVQVCKLNLKVYVPIGAMAVQSGIARSKP